LVQSSRQLMHTAISCLQPDYVKVVLSSLAVMCEVIWCSVEIECRWYRTTFHTGVTYFTGDNITIRRSSTRTKHWLQRQQIHRFISLAYWFVGTLHFLFNWQIRVWPGTNCYSFTYSRWLEGWVGLSTTSVNNLLKVITRQWSCWDLELATCESVVLTLPLHQQSLHYSSYSDIVSFSRCHLLYLPLWSFAFSVYKELSWSMLKWVIFGLQTSSGHQMLGVHHSAMTTVHFGKIARKHGLTGVCLDLLSRYAVHVTYFWITALFTINADGEKTA